jgi:H+/Cl- antiporter ClcA
LLVTFTSSIASVPLAYAFLHREVEKWWHDEPGNLAILLIVGLLLSFAGSVLTRYVPFSRLRPSSKLGHLIYSGIVGILFGLVAGGIGWLAAGATLWVLLLWFFFGAIILGGARVVLSRKAQSDG